MRRTYISPEYQNKAVYGTFNMVEESTFFGAKMLEVDDFINIDNQDIIYYQKDNGEQLDFSIESSLVSYVYSSSSDKLSNHKLIVDPTQSKYQLDNNTQWVLDINIQSILINYLFATLKKYRTFEGIKSETTLNNDVNIAMMSYINNNVLNRYKYKGIELFINYQDLRSQNILRYNNTWSNLILDDKFKMTKLQTQTQFDGSAIKIIFSQDKPSSTYKFEYYFNILFEKI